MTKWILIIALALGALLVWKFGDAFGLLFNAPKTTGDPYLSHVPDDTVFYTGGRYDEEFLLATSGFYRFPTLPSQTAQFRNLFGEGDNSPAAKFFGSLMDQFKTEGEKGFVTGLQDFGIASKGYYAFYMHGAVPVFRFPLMDQTALLAKIDKAVLDSGFNYTTEVIGKANGYLWRLTDADDDFQVDFVLGLEAQHATMTFVFEADDIKVREERLAQTKITNNLKASGDVEAIQQKYGFKDFSVGFISVINIVKGIVEPEANGFGKDLARYLPASAKEDFYAEQSEACSKEFVELFAAAPRIATGYNSLEANTDVAAMSGKMIWELNNETVKAELLKMRGHVPNHALDSKNSIMSFGMGFDMDGFVPALTALWVKFTQAPFTCDSLVELQAQVREQNPAMMQMFLGMAQGVKGLGVSIFDVDIDQVTMQPNSVSALISLAATSPQTIASLTSMIPLPQLNGINIPADGTPVKLDIPMVPPSIEVKAAIKGQHLVVYAGEAAAAVANNMTNEALTPNGVYGLGMNYRKFSKYMDLAGSSMNFAGGGSSSCVEAAEQRHLMSYLNMDFSFLMDYTTDGIDIAFDGSVDQPEVLRVKVGGKYRSEFMDDNCEWELAGEEVLNSDGTGSVRDVDEITGCSIFEMDYNWEQKGSEIIFSNSETRSREDCDSEFEVSKDEPYNCFIINIEGGSFECVFEAGTEDASVYRYTPMN